MRSLALSLAAAFLLGSMLAPALAMPTDAEPGWSARPAADARAPAAAPSFAPAAEAASVAEVRVGMDVPSIPMLAERGMAPDLASLWVGSWIQEVGWGHFEELLAQTEAAGATPVVHFWYWGDAISPDCVEHGCWDPLHRQQLSQDGWNALAGGLAARLAGRDAIVVLESEFNKNGIDSDAYAPRFAGLLAQQAERLRQAEGVRVALGFGGWAEDRWHLFQPAVDASDLMGFQAMRASTRADAADYAGVADAVERHARMLQARFGLPVLLTDLALSSHPSEEYEARQAEALHAIAARLPALREAGVEGILYRALPDDPGMDLANYFGEAERHWGLVRADGSEKPALDAWRALVQG